MLIFAFFMAAGSDPYPHCQCGAESGRGNQCRSGTLIISGGGEVRGGSEAEPGGRLRQPLQCLHQDT